MADHYKRQRKPSRRALESQEYTSRSRSPINVGSNQRGNGLTSASTCDVIGRGRGRGRGPVENEKKDERQGTGRGKGRGRGRVCRQVKKVKDKKINTTCEIEEIRGERKKKIKDLVKEMSAEDMRSLLVFAIQRDPFLITKIEDHPHSEDHISETQGNMVPPNWCVCSNCREMPSDVEKRCCRRTPANCISTSRDMEIVVLDPVVLYVYRMYRRDIFALHAVDEGDINTQNRHAAYRSFVLWTWGRLTAGDRRVIPSCCVWRIRDTYPDSHRQYKGFVPGRLG